MVDYVCWKNYLTELPLSDAEMQSPDVIERLAGFALAARPLLDWGWSAEAGDIPAPLTLKMPARPIPKPDFC